MWLNITVTIIIIFIVLLSLGGIFYVNNTTAGLNEDLSVMEESINNGQWNKARETFKKVNKSWEQATNIFPLILDHAELHDLEITLARIESYIEQKDKANILPEIKISLELLKNIKKQQKMSLQNIF